MPLPQIADRLTSAVPERRPTRVLVVDVHPLLAGSIEQLLAFRPDIDVVDRTASLTSSTRLLDKAGWLVDLVLLHVVRVDEAVTGLTRVVTAGTPARPAPHVLVISGAGTDDELVASLQAGARGYLTSAASCEELVHTVQLVAEGGAGFNASIAARLPTLMRDVPQPAARDALRELTGREREVLDLVIQGYNNRRIARSLFLSEKTVRNHLSHVFVKLQVHNRMEAALVAREAAG